jgi:hypothetical protein
MRLEDESPHSLLAVTIRGAQAGEDSDSPHHYIYSRPLLRGPPGRCCPVVCSRGWDIGAGRHRASRTRVLPASLRLRPLASQIASPASAWQAALRRRPVFIIETQVNSIAPSFP